MKIIILAAGMGIRLRPYTLLNPKPLIPLGDKPIIDHILDSLSAVEFDDIIVVGGYLFENLSSHLAERSDNIAVLENQQYSKGNILSLLKALEYMVEDTLIMNSDHIYPSLLIESFVSPNASEIRVACDFDRRLSVDDMKIQLDAIGKLLRIGQALDHFDGGYIGMTFIPSLNMDNYLLALEQTYEERGIMANVEEVLMKLIAMGKSPVVVDLSGYSWMEIDTVRDLNHAQDCIKGNNWGNFWNDRNG